MSRLELPSIFGKKKAGCVKRTHMVGYNGIVTFSTEEEVMMMDDKFRDGKTLLALMDDGN
jgi:hypothetical protein